MAVEHGNSWPGEGNAFSKDEKQTQVANILRSESLKAAPMLRRLFNYLAQETIEGRSDSLKELCIGLDAFKIRNFKPETNAIVRTQAIRLREKLQRYYAGEGRNDSIVIQIPKGQYALIFRTRADAPQKTPLDRPSDTTQIIDEGWSTGTFTSEQVVQPYVQEAHVLHGPDQSKVAVELLISNPTPHDRFATRLELGYTRQDESSYAFPPPIYTYNVELAFRAADDTGELCCEGNASAPDDSWSRKVTGVLKARGEGVELSICCPLYLVIPRNHRFLLRVVLSEARIGQSHSMNTSLPAIAPAILHQAPMFRGPVSDPEEFCWITVAGNDSLLITARMPGRTLLDMFAQLHFPNPNER
jgi:hypothetical protein